MIQSVAVQLAPDENGHVFLIFDTVCNHKHVFTACGVGRIQRNEAFLTVAGQATLHALCRYAEAEGLGAVHLVEVATRAAAPVRVRKALEAADEKDVVFLVCRQPDVYDAAIEQLGMDWHAGRDASLQ